QQVLRPQGDQRNRRAGADAGHAPADAEERRAGDKRRIDTLVFGLVEAGIGQRRASAASIATGHGQDDQSGCHDEGEPGGPATAGYRREVEELQNLVWVDHLRDIEAGAEEHTTDGSAREIRKLQGAGHAATPVTITVTMATPKKTAT